MHFRQIPVFLTHVFLIGNSSDPTLSLVKKLLPNNQNKFKTSAQIDLTPSLHSLFGTYKIETFGKNILPNLGYRMLYVRGLINFERSRMNTAMCQSMSDCGRSCFVKFALH